MTTHGLEPDAGFTLVEMLVVCVTLLALTGAALGLVRPMTEAAKTTPADLDAIQRARVASEVLLRDLMTAGSAVDSGSGPGGLAGLLPAVLPRTLGPNANPFDAARPEAITVLAASATPFQSTLAVDLLLGATTLRPAASPNCPVSRPACGLAVGDDVLVYDGEGHFDVFAVTGVAAPDVMVEPHGGVASHSYPAGTTMTLATSRSYYFDAAAGQLRFSDGHLTDVPLADQISRMTFDYYGDPTPPIAPRPPLGTANCLYDAGGTAVGGLATLAADGGSLARLPLAMFADGPWCGAGDRRFDADLLRIRKIRVTLQVRAAQSGLGVRDVETTFDVTPRNLNLGR